MASQKKDKEIDKASEDEQQKGRVKPKTSSKSSKKPLKDGKKPMSFIKKLLLWFMFFVAIVLAVIVYFIANFDKYKGDLLDKIQIALERVSIDPEKLTEKNTKVNLHFKVNNSLPLTVIFKKLNFDMTLGNTKVAKGMQAEAKVVLPPSTDTNVIIGCNVDSIAARRAIQKGIEKSAGKILKSILSHKSVKKIVGEDVKGITLITGSTELGLKLWSLEIPLVKKVNF